MNKEAYVSFETAERLKEKDFDWKCIAVYITSDDVPIPHIVDTFLDYNHGTVEHCISCPTQQMVMRWLREKKMIFISPFPTFKSGLHYSWRVDIKSCFGEELGGNYEYITYEDAVEAALEYILTNLI
jgi:hypothetical protein